ALNGIKDVSVTSAYRSYSYQKWLFNYYVENNLSKYPSREECEKYVMTFSCREGCSEHQTGLCCDMHNLPAADKSFGNTKAAKWLAENAHRFGFVLRFPADKEKITGIEYEPWHFRFVGRKAATHMYLNNLCLEEYVKELN
ncbi:MAG: M15 family metallopeptidase, partial [Clostridia bacterium]